MKQTHLLLTALLFAPWAALASADASKPVKVFILAGQSNMEGKAPNALLDHQATNASTRDLFAHLRKDNPWIVRDDVFIRFLERKGPLTVGCGSPGRTGAELELGTVMGDSFDEPVILVKPAWGGRSVMIANGQPAAGDAFIGLQPGLGSLPLLGQGRTRSISAENPTGEKGKGGMATPNPTELKPAASARAADKLGQGWKVRPFIRLNAHETAVLMDVTGSGILQHIWMVEGLNRGLVIRFYWDGEETPSVEAPVPDFFGLDAVAVEEP